MTTWWQQVETTVWQEFADLPAAAGVTRITIRLLIAAILGGMLGFEREQKGKAAGLRTHMLVALGAALFVLIPQQEGPGQNYLVNTEGVPLWLQQGAIVSNSGTIANNSNAAAAAEGQPNVEIILTRVLSADAGTSAVNTPHSARPSQPVFTSRRPAP